MSLHELGEVFDEPNPEKARQRWSHRVRRWMNKTVEDAGGVAHMKFQKSESARRKYAEAQRGNRNRLGSGKK